MKEIATRIVVSLALGSAALASQATSGGTVGANTGREGFPPGRIVVANRAGGTISVVDVTTDTVVLTQTLPGSNPPEPMYVNFLPRHDLVLVGDRANDEVVAYDPDDFSVVGTVPTGDGVFHMETDDREVQMWVVNDVDKSMTVFDPSTLGVITTVPVPADLVAAGAKPHDVVLDPDGHFAYVTMFDVPDADVVVQFSTTTFLEVSRTHTGESPHAFTVPRGGFPLVALACQGSNVLDVVHYLTLKHTTVLPVPGAHGGTFAGNRTFYVANFPGGGTDAVWAIRGGQIIGSADTPFPNPHNLAVSLDRTKLYCTHSTGTGTDLSVFDLAPATTLPVFRTSVTVGTNPYGLAAIR